MDLYIHDYALTRFTLHDPKRTCSVNHACSTIVKCNYIGPYHDPTAKTYFFAVHPGEGGGGGVQLHVDIKLKDIRYTIKMPQVSKLYSPCWYIKYMIHDVMSITSCIMYHVLYISMTTIRHIH